MPTDRHALRELHTLFASVRNPKEAEMLIDDILTPSEVASLVERWQLIQLLAKGVKQREIKKKLNISISKITRGSHMLKNGGGGFMYFLRKLKKIH